jgi:hypothetical protein
MAFTIEQKQVMSSLMPTRSTERLVDGKLQLPRG